MMCVLNDSNDDSGCFLIGGVFVCEIAHVCTYSVDESLHLCSFFLVLDTGMGDLEEIDGLVEMKRFAQDSRGRAKNFDQNYTNVKIYTSCDFSIEFVNLRSTSECFG